MAKDKKDILNIYEHDKDSQTELESGLIHYKGALGEFDYDPSLWTLNYVDVPMDGLNTGCDVVRTPCLQFNDKEDKFADGDLSKLEIPPVKDASFMFAGSAANSITKLPDKMPDTIQTGLHMYGNCVNVKDASNVRFSKNLENSAFMFSGCSNLEKGPNVIPSSVKNMDGMFQSCVKLQNTPVISNGVESAAYAFANCQSLTKKPNKPKSLDFDDNLTYGCSGLDAATSQETKKIADKRMKKADRQAGSDSATIGDNLKGLLAIHMQYRALQHSGWGAVSAMAVVVSMRYFSKEGTQSNADGYKQAATIMRNNRNNFEATLYNAMANGEAKSQEDREKKRTMNSDTMRAASEGNVVRNKKNLKSASDKAYNDVKNDRFASVASAKGIISKRDVLLYEGNSKNIDAARRMMAKTNVLGPNARKSIASDYKQELVEASVYYNMAKLQIQKSYKKNSKEYAENMKGLETVMDYKLDGMMPYIEKAQKENTLFNNGDIHEMHDLLAGISSERADAFESFMSDMSKGRQSHVIESARQSRVLQAMEAFGSVNEVSPEDSDSYEM